VLGCDQFVGNANSLLLNSTTADSLVDFQNNLDLGATTGTRTVNVANHSSITTPNTDYARIPATSSARMPASTL